MNEDAARAIETLRWWAAAGVDFAIDETPRDRFAESAASSAASSSAGCACAVARGAFARGCGAA